MLIALVERNDLKCYAYLIEERVGRAEQHLAGGHCLGEPCCRDELLVPDLHGCGYLHSGLVGRVHVQHHAASVKLQLVPEFIESESTAHDDLFHHIGSLQHSHVLVKEVLA